MRRSAAAAAITIAVAGIVATVALAKSGAQVKVPAPAIGKTTVETFTIKISGPKPGHPTLKVANAAALGKGFGGAAVIGQRKGKQGAFTAILVMFMGNLSSSPASTVSLQVTPPAGDTASASDVTNATKNCTVIHEAEHAHPGHEEGPYNQWFLEALGISEPEQFLHNVAPFLSCK